MSENDPSSERRASDPPGEGSGPARRRSGQARPTAPAIVFSLAQIRHLMRVEFARAQRYGYPIAVLAVGLDGRAELRRRGGDELAQDALDALVEILRSSTRTCDHLGRLVDDRFLAVLPHTPPEGAEHLAHRLLAAAAAHVLQDGTSLSVSVGAACAEGGETLFFDVLVEGASAAVDEAQRAGGGRLEWHRLDAASGGRAPRGRP